MIQYTCDQCGRVMGAQRYSVNIEVRLHENDELLTEADLDQDHLHSIAEEISQMDSTSEFQLPEPKVKTMKLDLCSPCTRRFEKDPLGRETRQRFNISPN